MDGYTGLRERRGFRWRVRHLRLIGDIYYRKMQPGNSHELTGPRPKMACLERENLTLSTLLPAYSVLVPTETTNICKRDTDGSGWRSGRKCRDCGWIVTSLLLMAGCYPNDGIASLIASETRR
jgi:hypothetical protein